MQGSLPRSQGTHLDLRLSTSAVLQAVLLLGIFVVNFFMPTDPDFWWHLATGRYTVETGAIPLADPFSYTKPGEPVVPSEWLGQVLIYLLYRHWGYVGAVAFFGAVAALAMWVQLRTLRLMGAGVALAVLLTLWAAAMSLPGWNVRTQMASYLFFSICLYLLIRSRTALSPQDARGAGLFADRWLWSLPVVMALWGNLHGAYSTGFVLIGLFIAGEAVRLGLDRLAGKGSAAPPDVGELERRRCWLKRSAAAGAVSFLATSLNPQGPAVLLLPLTLFGSRSVDLQYVTEWQSPNFHEPYMVIFAASLLLALLLPGRRPVDWGPALPMLGMTAMALLWIRAIPFYALTVFPYLMTRSRAQRRERPASTAASHASRWNWLLLGAGAAIILSTPFASERAQVGREPRTEGYPVEGVRYLKEAGLTGNLLNAYHWGGYILWSFYPERRVFIDGRSAMYGPDFMLEYRRFQAVQPGWQEVLDRYGVEAVLIPKDGQASVLLAASGAWKEAFRGPIESVFVPENGRSTR